MEDSAQHPSLEQAAPAALAPILASARRARLNKTSVSVIAEAIKAAGINARAAIHEALKEHDGHAATVLLVGATMNGYRPDAVELGEILPLLTDMGLMGPLLGCCVGDRLKMLVEVLESGKLSWQRQAFGCLLALELLGDAPPPPDLLTQMRLLARENLAPETGVVLGMAAQRVQDPATREVAQIWIDLAKHADAERMVSSARQMLAETPADALSDAEVLPFAGATLRRASPKIGRNDPCHCGSGRKYKKCCAEKDAARLADPSPVAGVTMSEYLDRPEDYLDLDRFRNLSVRDVARLDYGRLSTLCVLDAVRLLTTHRFWAEAEAAMEVLSSRADLPMDNAADKYRAELIDEALKAQARDVVARQVAKVQDPTAIAHLRMNLDLFTPVPETLNRIDDLVREHLRDQEQDATIDLAYALLDHFPALGILLTRGILNPERALDMELLLEDVERARDRLQLPPGDIAHEVYEYLLDRDLDTLESEGYEDSAVEKLAATAAEQQARLKEASAKVAFLEKRLHTQEALLLQTKAERIPRTSSSQPVKSPSPTALESEEIKRLRTKVAELKGLIAESHKERSSLRLKLAEATARMEQTASDGGLDGGDRVRAGSEDARESPELDAGMPSRWSTLVPTFRNTARDAIRSAQPPLARQALQTAATLAAGDQSAWSGIKRLRAIPDVWSARIGLHYRLLFRLEPARGTMEVTAFIHRRDLESMIAKGGL